MSILNIYKCLEISLVPVFQGDAGYGSLIPKHQGKVSVLEGLREPITNHATTHTIFWKEANYVECKEETVTVENVPRSTASNVLVSDFIKPLYDGMKCEGATFCKPNCCVGSLFWETGLAHNVGTDPDCNDEGLLRGDSHVSLSLLESESAVYKQYKSTIAVDENKNETASQIVTIISKPIFLILDGNSDEVIYPTNLFTPQHDKFLVEEGLRGPATVCNKVVSVMKSEAEQNTIR